MENLTLAKQETSGGKTAVKASFNLIMIFLMVAIVATDAGLSVLLDVSGVLNGIAYPCLAAAVFAAIYCFYPAPKIQQLALLAMWMFVVTSGLSILIQLAGRSPTLGWLRQAKSSQVRMPTIGFFHHLFRCVASCWPLILSLGVPSSCLQAHRFCCCWSGSL